jgi:CheY-like chemotaxis protein
LLDRVTVFIVEDDQLLASALSVQIEMLGYSVIGIATSQQAAVEVVLTQGPDIAIMDVNLEGGGSGLEAANIIRRRRDVPIIFYTAYGDESFRRQIETLSHTQLLQKPASDEALEEALITASHCENELPALWVVPSPAPG